jgi:hypothetical protein
LLNNQWENRSSATNIYSYTEYLSAIYFIGYKEIKKWSMQGGLRLEAMYAEGNQSITNNNLKRNNTNLFPTFYLGYQINQYNKLRSSYSRRINRPSFYSLMPYQTLIDSLDIWKGNPDLKPEFSNRVELSYAYKNKLFFTLSYTITHDLIRYVVSQDGSRRSSMYFPINIDKFTNFDLSISTLLKPAKWWNLNLFSDLYFNEYYNLQNADIFKSYITLNQNFSNIFQLSNKLKVELNFNYITKQTDQIFDHKPLINNVSFGLQTHLLKEKGNLIFNISDPFGWYKKIYKASFIKLYETGTYRYASRSIGLSFSYRFGKTNVQGEENTTASQEEQNR